MKPSLGLRVVRGPDWEWGDQDGGEGFVGTVTGLEEGGGGVVVQWDMGQRCRYRCGRDNKFDLRVLDSGPLPCSEVTGIDCTWCGEESLVGCVWRCVRCLDYYLCNQCYHNDRHSTRHPFFLIPSSTNVKIRQRVGSRREGERIPVRGIFAGAHVTRGTDWRWGNQDGGVAGIVLVVKGWKNETKGSVVEVQWEGNGHKNVYRVGHKGKMDLKCLIPGEGGWYTPEHLPQLGHTSGWDDSGDFEFAAGDTVRVDLDLESAKLMQEGHGGWSDAMNGCIRDVGEVIMVFENGDVQVRYASNSVFTFNPVVLLKVDIPFHTPGTAVRVLDDIARVGELQTVGPGWNDEITLTLGMVGIVTKRNSNGEIQASVNGQRWLYHPQCLEPLPRHVTHTIPDVGDVDRIALMKVLTIMQQEDPREAIWYLAATGDVAALQNSIERHPEEINRKSHGKTAVHVTCTEGFIGCLKLLLSYQPDLEIMDDNGMRPIHVCAYSNFAEAARLLLEHGADANSKDSRENTAAMAAGALGHYEVLEVLLDHRLLNIHAGDHIGSTALHCAVIAKRTWAVRLFLEAGADPSIPNYTASTPLHDAASTGFLTSVEHMVAYFPQHINLDKRDDGYTPLHSAVLHNRLDVAQFLMAQPSCQMERRTSDKGFTALHIAISEGYTAMVELLVGYGADVNSTVENGDTALMMVLSQKKMKPLNSDTPHLKQIDECLVAGYERGSSLEPYLFVACMLTQEGADPLIKNRSGETALQKCRPDLASVIRLFAQKQGNYRGSLRLKTAFIPTNVKRKTAVTEEAALDPLTEQALAGFPKHLKEDTKPAVDPPTTVATDSGVSGERATTETPAGEATREATTESRRDSEDSSSGPPTATRQESEDRQCPLCEKMINAKLDPCGHSVMCKDCAGIAKRCPTCNEKIQGSSLIC